MMIQYGVEGGRDDDGEVGADNGIEGRNSYKGAGKIGSCKIGNIKH